MADHINNPERPARYTGAFWAYVGPVLALLVVFAIAMLYWMNNGRTPAQPGTTSDQVIGTSGKTTPDDRREGGFQPQPKPDSTTDEIEHRGSGK